MSEKNNARAPTLPHAEQPIDFDWRWSIARGQLEGVYVQMNLVKKCELGEIACIGACER